MKQTKKQWCKDWIESFGCNNEEVIELFYEFMGGKGKKPNMNNPEIHKFIVKETLKFKGFIAQSIWKCETK